MSVSRESVLAFSSSAIVIQIINDDSHLQTDS